MRLPKQLVAGLVLVIMAGAPWRINAADKRRLTMYFIDVEGGQSTLIVTPAGESLLVDTGYAADGRDSARILAAARDAGITRIDHLLLTHFHPDHEGGATELSGRIPIGTFYDHGDFERSEAVLADPGWPRLRAAYEGFVAARAKGKHVEPKVATRLPLGHQAGLRGWI